MNSQILNNPYYNYYVVNSMQYATKLFAKMAAGQEHGVSWELPCFDAALSKVNLLEEPVQSLDYFYIKRAEQLRNSYDYLILHYSGGHDSHQILETFMLNGIFIDEILILDQFDRSFKESLEDKNFEFLHQNAYEAELTAIPLAKHFIETYSPKTKLTIVDNSFGIHAKYWLNLSEKDMYENLKLSGTLGMIGKTPIRTKDLNLYSSDFKKIKQNKKVAHIWGRDKVILRYDSLGYFIIFADGSFVDFIDVNYSLTKDSLLQEIEFFYTHPDHIEMIVKQAHAIMNKLPFYKVNKKDAMTRAHENLLANIIYKRKIQAPYLGLKAGDFSAWTAGLYKKDIERNHLTLFNMAELVLFKNLDSDISDKFNKQATIIGNLIGKLPSDVEKFMSDNYSTKKYYIKYFD
jgi:hypothetical protein